MIDIATEAAPAFVRPREAAAMTKLSLQVIYGAIEEGHLKAVRFGRALRIPREEFDRFCREGRP